LTPLGSLLMPWEGPWDHPGPPREPDPKTQKDHFVGRPFQPRFYYIFVLFRALLSHVFQASQMMSRCLQNVRKGVPQLHILDGNAQIEKLRFDCAGASGSRVRHAGKHVKSNKKQQENEHSAHTLLFVKSDTKDCQNGHRFSLHFTMISGVIFKHQKKQKNILGSESR